MARKLDESTINRKCTNRAFSPTTRYRDAGPISRTGRHQGRGDQRPVTAGADRCRHENSKCAYRKHRPGSRTHLFRSSEAAPALEEPPAHGAIGEHPRRGRQQSRGIQHVRLFDEFLPITTRRWTLAGCERTDEGSAVTRNRGSPARGARRRQEAGAAAVQVAGQLTP